MALFFFVVGMEIRREFDMGELRERRARRDAGARCASVGMVVPAAIYIAMNSRFVIGTGVGASLWAPIPRSP